MPSSTSPPGASDQDRVFSALLRYWRTHRGMSQLDLSVTAEVSARHISFLETGRSRPSVEMVLLLAEVLAVPMRDANDLLMAAGFAPRYEEPDVDAVLAGPVGAVVDTMLAHHEPFPMMVVDRLYNLVRVNNAAVGLLGLAGVDASGDADGPVPNVLRMLFAPELRPLIPKWDDVAPTVLRRLQRESLHHPQDREMTMLLDDLLGEPGVPDNWRQPDLAAADQPMIPLEFALDDLRLNFLTTITEFNAATTVTLGEIRIESWFPLDDETDAVCRTLFGPTT